MPLVVGYGEDALTYWALKEKLGSILEELEDHSAQKNCFVLYRPSFGRGKRLRRPTDRKAEFGEFDAILVTPQSTYLIESKWDNLSEREKVVIRLRGVQELRHRIFAWYCEKWNVRSGWKEFVERHKDEFEDEFGKFQRKIAPPKSLLSENLKYVLDQLRPLGKEIKNVLLYFYHEKPPEDIKIKSDLSFHLVPIKYPTTDGSNYIEMCTPRYCNSARRRY